MANTTIKEIAALCGVAVSTVSRAMNGSPDVSAETRRKVLEMAAKYNYVPNASARSLKAHSTNVIAVLVQGELSPIFLPMIQMFEERIKGTEFSMMLTFIPDDEADPETLARIVRDRKISGVVFLGRYGDRAKGAMAGQRLAEMGTPLVFCTTTDFSGTRMVHSSVSVDDRGASRAMTQHLLEQGHREIAYVAAGGPGDVEQVWALRIEGFRDAMIEWPEPTKATVVDSALPDHLYTMDNGYESMLAALDGGLEATAVMAVCDAVAVGLYRALAERGIQVPQDMSVVGFDDIDIASYTVPALTTVRQPLERIVEESTRAILDAITNPDGSAGTIFVPAEIIDRDSVAAPRANASRRA
ncbi:LacI family DNA-binding transcriptional regulator [Demequina capsici]|uniref:LacI family DNA-binding transcriptional regulator n=1 Tax=Demequina capsici TaxID=3075620 RepID=A0AA96JBC7_9MICO|nr:LacI family DNA-binding transcriptional regulator [Demequina sp. OYTSA14]WNM25621.1 LacI family DNA-binding transcriptional regulator [Demequina sp. OYTSA14]